MKGTIFAIFAVIIAALGAAPAYSSGRPVLPGEVVIEVVSDNGTVFQAIPHKEFWTGSTHVRKRYLEARQGEHYGIVITNRTPERVGVVIAVDGRNIITGKSSNLGNTESMYIVNAYEEARYDGWRTSKDEVHRFYFTTAADSYSVRTFADSSAMGVIAMAVFREKEQPRPLQEEKREGQSAPSAPSADLAPKSAGRALAKESAGTGFGDARYSPVIPVQFEPERNPAQKTLVKYEWREVLCRKGILRCDRELGNRLWDEDGYAPYPPGYPIN
ncbi:MAG TPA: hypothetical protein VEM40_02950 [Nitrospirota bacterium]|nr:hypothetical protein [Nitrospirota bacterium]